MLCNALTDHTEAMLYVLRDIIRPQHHRKSWEKVVRNKETLKFSYLTVKNENIKISKFLEDNHKKKKVHEAALASKRTIMKHKIFYLAHT